MALLQSLGNYSVSRKVEENHVESNGTFNSMFKYFMFDFFFKVCNKTVVRSDTEFHLTFFSSKASEENVNFCD